jgi:cytochrome c oxidase cbb3-type subunit 3
MGGIKNWWRRHPRLGLFMLAAMVLAAGAGAIAIRDARTEAALLRADPDTLPADPAAMAFALPRGADSFSDHCAQCHGPQAKGDRSRGVPDLTDHDYLYGKGLVSQTQQIVKYGIRAQDPRGWNEATMPGFAKAVPYDREKLLPLSKNDVNDITQFLFAVENRPADAAAAARGQKLFDGRGACWDCHGEDGHGDDAIGAPNLTDQIWLFGDGSADAIADSIERGHAGSCPAWVGRLSSARILEISLYVYSLSHPKDEPGP